jgi:hypothetical protein
MYEEVRTGTLAGAISWGIYFRLTVERAAMLLANYGTADLPKQVDLTQTIWCDR